MDVSIAQIKELRKITSVGIVECKNALKECGGSIEKAIDYLREKGIAKAYKKLNREVNEGVVGIYLDGKVASIIELNSETDFVSLNSDFQSFARDLAYNASKHRIKVPEQLLELVDDKGNLIKDSLMNKIAVIGENISLRRVDVLSVDEGVIGGYVHNSKFEGVGKSASLVALKSDCSDFDSLRDLANNLAMHVVAMKPESLSIDTLDTVLLSKERELIEKQVKDLGKNSVVTQKIVEGKLAKFYQEVVLLEQVFVMDDNYKICEFISAKAKELNSSIELVDYKLFSIS